MPGKGTYPAYERIAREASEADEANVSCFENRATDPAQPESQELDEAQLKGFESVVIEWLDRQHGQERKAKAIAWFGGMLSRLRKRIGTDEKALNQSEELDRIGMAIVSDCVVTTDGDAQIGFERLAPRLSRLHLPDGGEIRIVGAEELTPAKCKIKLKTRRGDMACREFVFRDALNGKIEIRRYTLLNGDVRRVERQKVRLPWLTWMEHYALSLIRSILSEISK